MKLTTTTANIGSGIGSNTTGLQTLSSPQTKSQVVLTEAQLQEVTTRLAQLDFPTIPTRDIVSLGFEEYQGLQRTLDGFLSALGTHNADGVFQIFEQLSEGVDQAKLKDIALNIGKIDKPNMVVWFFQKFRSRKSITAHAQKTYQMIVDRLQGKTRTLCEVIRELEQELGDKITMLFSELQRLDQVKESYSAHRQQFTVAVAVSEAFLEKAKQHVEQVRAELKGSTDSNNIIKLSELETKLQLLESRTIALLGTFTKLPTDQLVIQQIEHAGIATIQETMTTASGRFASIKMTLLELHGAIQVKGLQRINGQQAELEQHLHEVRTLVTHDIVTAAAKAPGENRVAQANQLMAIVNETKALIKVVDAAREENNRKFNEARQIISAARAGLDDLHEQSA